MTAAETVRVVFVDADDGQEIARSDMAVAALPESFEPDTTVQLGEETWLVRQADPPTAALATAFGELVLTLRRIEMVPARDVLYGLPTICDPLPDFDETLVNGGRVEIHEDDWRQVELVHDGLLDEVAAEIREIRRVQLEHAHRGEDGAVYGFETIYVRTKPNIPLPHSASYQRLLDLLPAIDNRGVVGIRGCTGAVVGSFAITTGSLALYGTASDDRITTLCLLMRPAAEPAPEVVAGLRAFMKSFGLVLVDWCHCQTYAPAAVGDFFTS